VEGPYCVALGTAGGDGDYRARDDATEPGSEQSVGESRQQSPEAYQPANCQRDRQHDRQPDRQPVEQTVFGVMQSPAGGLHSVREGPERGSAIVVAQLSRATALDRSRRDRRVTAGTP
jgi:hypothetical protein